MQLSRRLTVPGFTLFIVLLLTRPVFGQSVASGTIEGTVVDPSGAVVAGATVELRNPITGFLQTGTTDSMGIFRFTNVPFNPYHLQVSRAGFATTAQDLRVRSTVPIALK